MDRNDIKRIEEFLYSFNQRLVKLEFLEDRLSELESLKHDNFISSISYDNINISCTNKISDVEIEKYIKIIDEIEVIKKRISKNKRFVALIRKAVDNLPNKQKAFIEERYFNYNKFNDVADILKVSIPTLASYRKKAFENLRLVLL